MYDETSPNTSMLLDSKTFTPRPNQRRVWVEKANGAREEEWGTDADDKIKLPGIGAAGVTFGLDLDWMAEWWAIFRAAPHPLYKYASKSKNCSGVAAAALRVGGGDRFATPPTALMYIDPNQIGRWAREIKKMLEKRNAAVDAIAHDLADAGNLPLPPDGVDDLMSLRPAVRPGAPARAAPRRARRS